jgi:hypothetical protein
MCFPVGQRLLDDAVVRLLQVQLRRALSVRIGQWWEREFHARPDFAHYLPKLRGA